MSLIEDAATAAWDATFPTIPREERASLPEDFAPVARAVITSVHDSLAQRRDGVAQVMAGLDGFPWAAVDAASKRVYREDADAVLSFLAQED